MLDTLRMLLYGLDPPPYRRGRPWRFGQLAYPILAPLVALMSFNYLQENVSELRPAQLWLISGATGLSLLLLPRYPLMAFRVAFVLAIITGARFWTEAGSPWPWQPTQILQLPLLLYLVSLRHRRGVLFGVFLLVAVLVATTVDQDNGMGLIVAVAIILIFGDQVRRRREAQTRLIAEAERSQLEAARRTIVEERARIARELHDVVAHHMSLIAVRAETAPFRLGDLPAETAAEFSGIAGTSRAALVEMRRLLGVLRQEEPAPETAPQPGLSDVPALVDAARAAGVQVTYDGPPDDAGAQPGVQLSAYRIVQEALSNATRHAPGAPVAVAVVAAGDELQLAVINGASPMPAAPATPGDTHHGLVGMRERVAMLGGSLVAAPTDTGGFQVTAKLPLQAAEGEVP